MSALPPVSLILCSRNRPELLLASAHSILAGDDVPAELVIVDQSDARHEEVAGLSRKGTCHVRYLWTHTKGLSKANNIGARIAAHDILVFTHDDVLVTHDWLPQIVTALIGAGRRAVITGRVLPTEPEIAGGFVPTLKEDETPRVYQGRVWEDVLYPLNMAMYRSALEEIGPFDERLGPGTPFPGGEDNDLGYRLLEAGYRIHYLPDAVLYHRAWRRGDERRHLRWNYGRAQGAFYAKHWSFKNPYMIKRTVHEVAWRTDVMAHHLRYTRSVAGDQAVSIIGMMLGASEWLLTQRLRA